MRGGCCRPFTVSNANGYQHASLECTYANFFRHQNKIDPPSHMTKIDHLLPPRPTPLPPLTLTRAQKQQQHVVIRSCFLRIATAPVSCALHRAPWPGLGKTLFIGIILVDTVSNKAGAYVPRSFALGAHIALHMFTRSAGLVGITRAAVYPCAPAGYDVTSSRLIIPLSLPGRRATISSSTTFSSVRVPDWLVTDW